MLVAPTRRPHISVGPGAHNLPSLRTALFITASSSPSQTPSLSSSSEDDSERLPTLTHRSIPEAKDRSPQGLPRRLPIPPGPQPAPGRPPRPTETGSARGSRPHPPLLGDGAGGRPGGAALRLARTRGEGLPPRGTRRAPQVPRDDAQPPPGGGRGPAAASRRLLRRRRHGTSVLCRGALPGEGSGGRKARPRAPLALPGACPAGGRSRVAGPSRR